MCDKEYFCFYNLNLQIFIATQLIIIHWVKLSGDLIVKILRHVGAIEDIEGHRIDKQIYSISAINVKIYVALEDEECA